MLVLAVCVPLKFWSTDTKQVEQKVTQVEFALGPCSLTLGQGYRHEGSE